jgi:hypothetical protein
MVSDSFHEATQMKLPMYTTNGSTNFDVYTVLLVQFIIQIIQCTFIGVDNKGTTNFAENP